MTLYRFPVPKQRVKAAIPLSRLLVRGVASLIEKAQPALGFQWLASQTANLWPHVLPMAVGPVYGITINPGDDQQVNIDFVPELAVKWSLGKYDADHAIEALKPYFAGIPQLVAFHKRVVPNLVTAFGPYDLTTDQHQLTFATEEPGLKFVAVRPAIEGVVALRGREEKKLFNYDAKLSVNLIKYLRPTLAQDPADEYAEGA